MYHSIFKSRAKQLCILIFCSIFFAITLNVYADLRDNRENFVKLYSSTNDVDEQQKIQVEIEMIDRQIAVQDSFASMKARVDALLPTDTRRDSAKSMLGQAETAVNIFINMPVVDERLDLNPYRSNETFNTYEKNAIISISNVNKILLAPPKPGAVPEGRITEDFIPYIIRLFFRFAYLAVFVSFVISGVMFVTAYSAEERVTSAKKILYYSIIGAALVTLAFAIVKAITNINFFGFI